jgi:hypothetical protein
MTFDTVVIRIRISHRTQQDTTGAITQMAALMTLMMMA